MKKLIVLSTFVLLSAAALPDTQINAQRDGGTTETGKTGGYIFYSQGCYYRVVTHSILWGLITWEDEPVLMGCGPGGLWGE